MAARNSKKRKASELDDRPTANGHAKKVKGKKLAKKELEPAFDLDEPPFKVMCPAKDVPPDYKLALERVQLAKDFTFDYAVKSLKPDLLWEDVKSYKHVKLAEMSVTVGDTVYVLHDSNAKELKPDASEEEILAYDKKNCWVGKIIQAKAANEREVYILVAWLYWPKEIPKEQRSQPHFYNKDYADNELIMSNWLDIIDANSISAKADAYHVDEDNEEDLYNLPDRFWRQTFNAGEARANPNDPGLFSVLKSVCKCQRPINPAKRVLRCSKGSCRAWNHEQCIIDEIGDALWASYEDGKMDQYARDNAPEVKTLGSKIAGVVGAAGQEVQNHLKHLVEDGITAIAQETAPKLKSKSEDTTKEEQGVTALSLTPGKRGRPRKSQGVWSASLNITIQFDNKQPPVARVTEKFGKKRSWDLRVNCLVCGHTMD